MSEFTVQHTTPTQGERKQHFSTAAALWNDWVSF